MTRAAISLRVAVACSLLVIASACAEQSPVAPSQAISDSGLAATARINERACWGQATRVFARMGEMGQHASQFETPRLGLRNLARALYELGVLPDDSMQALGRFVAAELKLEIEACL